MKTPGARLLARNDISQFLMNGTVKRFQVVDRYAFCNGINTDPCGQKANLTNLRQKLTRHNGRAEGNGSIP